MAEEDNTLELQEYEYMVGHVPVTAMLTEKQARRLNATAVGESQSPGEGNVVNNEADRHATQTREAEDRGVRGPDSEQAAEKTRAARNKRAQ